MKVSFLVTYYNQKEYVKQSLDSILAIEKPCDWEILVGDDGSSDGTIDEVKKYVEKYPENITLYEMPRKAGEKHNPVRRASANRLNILEHSSGDFFCILDGDDYYFDTGFIKEAIGIFFDKSISVVAFGFQYVMEGSFGDVVVLPAGKSNRYVDKKDYLEHYYLHAGGCVYRKCYDQGRIDYIKKLGFFDDNNIVVNGLNYGELYAVNRPVYAYRITAQSVYTGMNDLEQAVLNVQGMDVDIRLLEDSFKDPILRRNASAVVTMYLWRKKIPGVLGIERLKQYKEGCEGILPSYCLDLLIFDNISADRKKEIRNILFINKKDLLRQYMMFLFRRRRK